MTSADESLLRKEARRLGISLEPGALARIATHLEVLSRWSSRLRLTAERDPTVVIWRHVVDCLAPAPLLPEDGLVADLGSGQGFPGITLGCTRPDLEIVLIESRRRRVSFLREVIRSIPLQRTRVLEARAEAVAGVPEIAGRARLVVARALRLDVLLALARPLLDPAGTVVAMQSPGALAAAVEAGLMVGLVLRETRGYELWDGSPRVLLQYEPVS